jgi:hypothetical protein
LSGVRAVFKNRDHGVYLSCEFIEEGLPSANSVPLPSRRRACATN